VNELVSIY